MAKYVLILRIPTSKADHEVPMYEGEDNTWVYLKSKAKRFPCKQFKPVTSKYRYKAEIVEE